ncbi:hypothetical protein ACIRPU_16755 [Streptomyces sp. NPDC102259]|uniref:hypothetical protein n=1 Tax=Streptomyces sp. NPDC102259 TaxID=3366148 RepID=UPI0038035680
MNLETGRDAYYKAADAVNQQVRQLALAGIAVVWLLAGGLQSSKINLNDTLLAAGICLISALALDLLHFVFKTATFAIWVRVKEVEKRGNDKGKNVDKEDIGDAPDFILPTLWVLFYLKVAAIGAAYGLIFSDMISRIHVS